MITSSYYLGIIVECFSGIGQCKIARTVYRSSRPEVLCKKGVLRNFTKFTGKHLCQSLFFSKVAGLRPATLFKKRLWHRCFPVNFPKFLRTPFFTESVWTTASMKHTEDRYLLFVFFYFQVACNCKLIETRS